MAKLTHPIHGVMVTTGGPFGRAWMDCPCGASRTLASGKAAQEAGLRHFAQEVPADEWPAQYRDLLSAYGPGAVRATA